MEIVHIYVRAIFFTVAVRLQPTKSHIALNTVLNRNTHDHSVQTGLHVWRCLLIPVNQYQWLRQQAGGGIPVIYKSVCTPVNNSRMDLTWFYRSSRRHKCSKISSFTRSVLSWFFWQSHNISFIIRQITKLVQTDMFLWLSSFANWIQTKKLNKSVLFWAIPRVMVIPQGRFKTNCGSHLQGARIKQFFTLEDGTDRL